VMESRKAPLLPTYAVSKEGNGGAPPSLASCAVQASSTDGGSSADAPAPSPSPLDLMQRQFSNVPRTVSMVDASILAAPDLAEHYAEHGRASSSKSVRDEVVESSPCGCRDSCSPCGCTRLCWLQVVAFSVFAAGNITLNEFNQWALSKEPKMGRSWPAFAFPVFYTMWHMFVSSLAAFLLTCEKQRPSVGQLWAYKFALVPLALCTSVSTFLNNKSFTIISLFLNQTIRAMGPLPTILFEWLLVGRRFDLTVIGCVGLICAGSVLACVYQFHGAAGDDARDQWAGVIMCTISIILSSLKPVIAMLLMKGTSEQPRLDPAVVLFYDASIAFFSMLIYWVSSQERETSIAYLSDPATRYIGIGVICAGASVAFIYNLATYYYVNLTSAVTASIGSNAVKMALIITSALQAHVADVTSWTGVGIVVVSIALYGYLTSQGRGQRYSGEYPDHAGNEGPPTPKAAKEDTPLAPRDLKHADNNTDPKEHDLLVLLMP